MKTNNRTAKLLAILAALLISPTCLAGEVGVVEGICGLHPSTETTALGFWVPLDDGAVVSGVRWYNSDGNVVFPRVLGIAGDGSSPELLAQATPLATNVTGSTLSWVDLTFDVAVTSATSGIYLIFQFPVGDGFVQQGQGGGPGLGYVAGDGIPRCWLTGDGEVWSPISPEHQIAAQAIMATNKCSNVLVLGKPRDDADGESNLEGASRSSLEIHAVPNPFNPVTILRFATSEQEFVRLDVFDVRGWKIRTLVHGTFPSGDHEVTWNGCDDNGRAQPSGVYLARLGVGNVQRSIRMTLVR
jgi:hypothetical protein